MNIYVYETLKDLTNGNYTHEIENVDSFQPSASASGGWVVDKGDTMIILPSTCFIAIVKDEDE